MRGISLADSVDVPEYMSARRASFISGRSPKTIALLPKHGPFRQVARADLEALIGHRVTVAMWDQATIEINHAGLSKREHA